MCPTNIIVAIVQHSVRVLHGKMNKKQIFKSERYPPIPLHHTDRTLTVALNSTVALNIQL